MHVQYTLPGYQPELQPYDGSREDDGLTPAFAGWLHVPALPETADWTEILRLDIPPTGPTQIEPPPQPFSLERPELTSPDFARRRVPTGYGRFGSSSKRSLQPASVQRMMDLLEEFQRSADAVRVRALKGEQR